MHSSVHGVITPIVALKLFSSHVFSPAKWFNHNTTSTLPLFPHWSVIKLCLGASQLVRVHFQSRLTARPQRHVRSTLNNIPESVDLNDITVHNKLLRLILLSTGTRIVSTNLTRKMGDFVIAMNMFQEYYRQGFPAPFNFPLFSSVKWVWLAVGVLLYTFLRPREPSDFSLSLL